MNGEPRKAMPAPTKNLEWLFIWALPSPIEGHTVAWSALASSVEDAWAQIQRQCSGVHELPPVGAIVTAAWCADTHPHVERGQFVVCAAPPVRPVEPTVLIRAY